MKTRCKFVVSEVARIGWQGMKPETAPLQERIKLSAICGGDGNEENQSFSSATPTGTLEIWVSNPAVLGSFLPGCEYYLELTPAAK